MIPHRNRKDNARVIVKRFVTPIYIETDHNGKAYGETLDSLLDDIVDAILYAIDHPEEIDKTGE